ncbi:MAG: hypothetical protein ABIW46_01655, partial [Acidimicrobiales bacterium]
MDGFGALRFLQSVSRSYRAAPDPAPELSLQEAREFPLRLVPGEPLSGRERRAVAIERARDVLFPLARLAGEGATGEAGYGFHHASLSPRWTAALKALPGARPANDVLLAALHLAIAGWNAERGVRCGHIGVLVPANLRPERWRDEMVGNFCLPVRVASTPADRRSPEACLLAIGRQTSREKRPGIGAALLDVFDRTRLFPLWAKQLTVLLLPLTGNRLIDTAMLADLGEMDEPLSFGDEAGATNGLWFSPPARMPLGLAVGAITTNGQLHLSFRYRHRLFDADACRRFADRYLAEVGRLLGPAA